MLLKHSKEYLAGIPVQLYVQLNSDSALPIHNLTKISAMTKSVVKLSQSYPYWTLVKAFITLLALVNTAMSNTIPELAMLHL